MTIVSKNNPIVKELASLKEKKGRRERGTYLVEGVKMVRECVKSGQTVKRIIVRENYAGEAYPFETVVLGQDAFSCVCDAKTPQPIAAEVQIPFYPVTPPSEACLLLDGVGDPANIGSIVRTAVAAGYNRIYCIDCADAYSPKSVRASMSGVFFAEIVQGTQDDILNALEGVPIIAADMNGENIFRFTPPKKFALAIGNEGNGLSEKTRAKASYTVKIPMNERTESLNASVSAGILMYYFKKNIFQ